MFIVFGMCMTGRKKNKNKCSGEQWSRRVMGATINFNDPIKINVKRFERFSILPQILIINFQFIR